MLRLLSQLLELIEILQINIATRYVATMPLRPISLVLNLFVLLILRSVVILLIIKFFESLLVLATTAKRMVLTKHLILEKLVFSDQFTMLHTLS